MPTTEEILKQKSGQYQPTTEDILKKKAQGLTHEKSFPAMTEEEQLKLKYGPLEKPGLEDFGLRADISMSRNFESQKRKFEAAYPYGELRQEGGTLLFRKTPAEEWQKVDAGMLEKFEAGDIADLAGDIPAIAGEVALTRGATRPFTAMGRAAIGAGLGDVARSGTEEVRGFEAPNWGKSAGTEAALGAGGEIAGLGIRGAVNAARGAGAVTPDPFVRQTMREAQRRGLPQLHPGQVTENPIVQAFARQSRALSGKIHDYEQKQEGAALDLLEGMRQRGEIMPLGRDLETALARRENEITRKLKARPPGQLEPGTALRKGINEYRDMSGRVVSHAYAEARKYGEPGFDISGLQETATGILKGVPAAAEGGVENVRKLNPELARIADEIAKLNPDAMMDSSISPSPPFEVLSELRGRLFDLKTPVDGVYRNEHRLASQLYTALSDTMKSPAGSYAPFVESWKKATALAKKRFDTLEQEFISKALRTGEAGDVEGLFRSLFRPNNANQIKFTREALAKHGIGKWNDFREGAIADLVSDPYGMWRTLKSFDDETLKEIFTGPEIGELKSIAFQFQRLSQAGIKEAALKQTQATSLVSDLIGSMNTAGADELFRISGGRNTPLGQKVRAGIVEWVYDRALERTKRGTQINRQSIIDSVSTLKQAGMLKFLTNEDKRALHVLLPDYLALVRGLKTDTGESIRRATIVQNLTDKPTEAIVDILEEVGIGRIMTTKWGHDIVYGVGRKPWNLATLRRFSSALAIMAKDYEEESKGSQ